jgi:tRNA-2-methylthio-N6-dimethylallyladenosine synthase
MLSALGATGHEDSSAGALLGVGGCVAQQEKSKLLERVPYLDFVFGPDAIGKLPEHGHPRRRGPRPRRRDRLGRLRGVRLPPRRPGSSAEGDRVRHRDEGLRQRLQLLRRAAHPRPRGQPPFVEVLREVASLTEVGVREVTLIGQNVNSYKGGISFAELLLRVAEVPGIERVRFTTSHPHDLSDALIDAFRTEQRIAPHFHLPVQSGSDAVLRR